MPLDEELVADIRKRADIVDVVGAFLPLTKKGKNFVAVCPFHDDTDPSLSISREKQMCHCFVCGGGGNSFSFVSRYLHLNFVDSVKKVAEIIGYDDPRLHEVKSNKPVDQKKVALLKCLKDLTLYYSYALSTEEGKDGLNYFESRNLNSYLRDKYKLGYAPTNGAATIEFLQKKGHSIKVIEDAGIIPKNTGGNYFDRSQGRVVFPICDSDGNVIGYSARRIKDSDEAKYVNYSDTYLFHKSNVLYNFHIAKDAARIAKCIYVLEGFMDVYALARINMDNAVAIMGTSLTDEHIALLRTLNVEIRMCLDGDLPGQGATLKCCKALENAGLRVSVVDNQGSTKDPDEILNSEGEDALKLYLNKLLSRVDFVLNYYQNSNPLQTNEQKKSLVNNFLPVLVKIRDPLELDSYIRKLSNITGYEFNSIKSLVEESRGKGSEGIANALKNFHPERKMLKRLAMAERELLYQMLNNPEAVTFYEHNVEGFYDEVYRAIANYVIEYVLSHPEFSPNDIIEMIENSESDNKEQLISEITALCFENTHPKNCTVELLNNLLESIKEEKEKIFDKDTLEESLKDKDEIEKARILAEYYRRKMKKKK